MFCLSFSSKLFIIKYIYFMKYFIILLYYLLLFLFELHTVKRPFLPQVKPFNFPEKPLFSGQKPFIFKIQSFKKTFFFLEIKS